MTSEFQRMDDSLNISRCYTCGKYYRIHPEKLPPGVTSFNCRKCGSLVSIALPDAAVNGEGAGSEVLVVVHEVELAQLILKILARNGFRGRVSSTGGQALEIISQSPPEVALVSVSLPDMMGYEMIDRLKEILKDREVPIILLSSLHHGTRYKRAPTSLYGANDHIERHHLPDFLAPKIRRLMDPEVEAGPMKTGPDLVKPPTDQEIDDRRELEQIHQDLEGDSDETSEERIRRTCRVIVGDIALYNEDRIKDSGPESVLEVIAAEIQEGVNLLKQRFPEYEGDCHQVLSNEMLDLLDSRGVGSPQPEEDNGT
ncbi:response regulator [bacterium]|nr:MAG: response regulator [bacterium]